MSESPSFLAERLKTEGEKTSSFFSSLTPEQWQFTVYTEGETWTVRNVLAHFVTAERGFIGIFGNIRDNRPGIPDDFDVNRYNSSQQRKTKDLSPADLIEQFNKTRDEMIALVASLGEDELGKEGRHPFLGQTTLVDMIKMVYRHNQIHYRDLRKTLAGEI